MSDSSEKRFDPYHKWLGIPPEDQPPHHYRLLGINLYENDASVIESAADRQMTHVKTHATGPHGDLSQKLLNEISVARVCLLNVERKAEYDRELKAQLAAEEAASQPAASSPRVTHSASDDHHEAPTLPPGKSKPASDDHHEAPTLPPGAKLPAGAAEEVQWSLEGPTLGNAPSIPEQFVCKFLGIVVSHD